MGNRYNVRIEGTRVRHSMGMASIKMYDQFGPILRIETTAQDVSFFKHYREGGPCTRRHGLIADSTSSTRTTKPFFWPLPAESSPSVARKNRRSKCRCQVFEQIRRGEVG